MGGTPVTGPRSGQGVRHDGGTPGQVEMGGTP